GWIQKSGSSPAMSCVLLLTNSVCWRIRWLMSPPVPCSIDVPASIARGALDPLQTKQHPGILSRYRVDVCVGASGLGVETQLIKISDRKGIIGAQQQPITPYHRAQKLQRRRMVHDSVIVKSLQVR